MFEVVSAVLSECSVKPIVDLRLKGLDMYCDHQFHMRTKDCYISGWPREGV